MCSARWKAVIETIVFPPKETRKPPWGVSKGGGKRKEEEKGGREGGRELGRGGGVGKGGGEYIRIDCWLDSF